MLTIPNLITFLRLIGLPVAVWAILCHHTLLAFFLVISLAITDYCDGKLARLLQQESALGAFLDPLADRLFMTLIPLSLALVHTISWVALILMLLRDLSLLFMIPILKAAGHFSLPVIYLGKVATLTLMVALILVLAGSWKNPTITWAYYYGIAALIWGLILYYYSALLYWCQVITIYRKFKFNALSNR